MSRHSRGVKANEVTEIFVERLQGRERLLRRNHSWVMPLANRLFKGQPVDPYAARPTSLSPRDQAHIIDTAAQVGVYKLWAKNGRVTYDVNEHLAQELYRSTYDKLPGNIFSHLAHINPLVVLPEPWEISWPVQVDSAVLGLVRGFYVHGFRHDPEQLTLTTDEVDGIGMLLVIDLLYDDTGEVKHQAYMRLQLPTSLEEFTVEQAVDYAAERVESLYIRPGKFFHEAMYRVIEEMLRPAVALLVYFCCDNRDAVEAPVVESVRRRRQTTTPAEPDPFWVEVGWRMGPRLHAARRAAGKVSTWPGVPTGVQLAPHQRGGHFHKYRVGPGRPDQRKELITRWNMPTWVGLDKLPEDMDPITSVVTVDPQRHDPLRSRGIKRANLGRTKAKEITERERQRAREEGWDF